MILILPACQTGENQPGVISGGSMAPTLLGRHYQVACNDCQFVFACDGINIPTDRQTVCPNCGFAGNELKPAQFVAPDRVSILSTQSPERWDVVAVSLGNESEASRQNAVKRVIALPGETMGFERGDILIDGMVVSKPLEIQKKLRIPVFDSDYRRPGDTDLASRILRVASPGVPEDGTPSTASAQSLSAVVDVEDRVRFQPITGYRSKEAGEPADAIKDFYAYNQDLSRKLNVVDQLFMQFDLLAEPDVSLMFQVPGCCPARITLNMESVDLEQDCGGQLRHQSFQMPLRQGIGLKIEISNFDRRLQLIVNDCEIFDLESWPEQERQTEGHETPLELAVAGGPCRLNRLQVWRDIYFFDWGRFHFSKAELPQAGEAEYFLLGDNVPVSTDSRHWGNPGVGRSQILGVVSETP
ncbi:MAG: S26 family signal peptidase [Mariniblastus sp.]|nr:S26 family signal peptidase [Mariniblastus sp.]